MTKKRVLTGILLVAVLLGNVPLLALAAPSVSRSAQEGGNLLTNGGFEADWGTESSHKAVVFPTNAGAYERPAGNIFTPPGWVTWYRQDPGDEWDQPEVKDAWDHVDERRVHSGRKGIQVFKSWGQYDAGFYQTVTGLEPGTTVKFSAYAQAWSCDRWVEGALSCGDQWALVFRVGIDPNGGTNPFAPNVVWSAAKASPDRYSLVEKTAQVGPEGKATVFLRSTASKWRYQYLDSYWDDASLVPTTPPATPTNTPLPAPPTATPGPSPTPLPTSTPRPDGAIVHIVQAGDTLFGIALRYDVPVDQIRELNASSLGPNDLIRVGQELVISLPSETPTPSPPPQPPTPTAAPVSPTPEGASICVLAFHDRNGDRVRDADEGLLPNAEFTLANASGVVAKYTTDGVSEPYCFTGLDPGNYRVIQSSPPGYEPGSSPEQNVALAEGTSFDFQFGNARSQEAATAEESGEPPSTDERAGGSNRNPLLSGVLASVARVAGVLVLILAAVIAVLFFLARGRRY